MSENRIQVAFKFSEPGYIGLPYWPAKNMLINIMKDVHAKLGEAKKQAAINASCEKRGVTPEQYTQLLIDADRPFYTKNGIGSEIVIPERIFQSFLNHASMIAPKAVPRISSKGLTFIGVKVIDKQFTTGKTKADGSFDRFVKNDESNQRQWSSSQYIANFTAQGVLSVDPEVIQVDELRKLTEWGGKWVGLGSARPQGYGRFAVAEWKEL